MSFTVAVPKTVQKQIDALPLPYKRAVTEHISSLAANPRPAGCVKLRDSNGWRIRVGPYRILYEIRDRELVIILVRVAHRRDAYR